MQKPAHTYPFRSIVLRNRLRMDIEIDIIPITIQNLTTIVMRSHQNYHQSTIRNNIEHIAFQLKSRFGDIEHPFSLIEYRQEPTEQWWQWRFNWVGCTPLKSEKYRLSSSRVQTVSDAIHQVSHSSLSEERLSAC